MSWRSSSIGLIGRVFSSRQGRFYSTYGTTISDFALTKKGTGRGSFIELPEFTPLQDSILVKVPSACTIYGKLNKINVISSEPRTNNGPVLAQDVIGRGGFTRIMTGEHPANLIMASPTPMSNIAVVRIDSAEDDGLYVPDFDQNVLCYSGDLKLRNRNQVIGFGIIALAGRGPVYQVVLKEGDEMVLTSESILAHDAQVQKSLIRLNSPYKVPTVIRDFFAKYFRRYYDQLLIKWDKAFTTGKVFTKIQGPGVFFLQTQFVPGSRKYTNQELLESTKSEA